MKLLLFKLTYISKTTNKKKTMEMPAATKQQAIELCRDGFSDVLEVLDAKQLKGLEE